MRFRVGRHFGVAALYLLGHLGLAGCSSTDEQQGEEELGAQEMQEGEQQEGEQSADAQGQEEVEDQQQEQMAEGQEEYQQGEEGEEVAEEGNSTESDLQEIISEMNGQGNAEAAPTNGNVAMAQTTPTQSAPMTESAPTTAMPSGPSAGPALPEMGSKMPYIVQSGDTLAKIATKIFGTNARWKEIASLTGLANPSRIYPGDVVYYSLDQSSVAFATAYDSVQRGSTQVQQGDTLATISQRVYGTPQSWKTIWRQNDGINNPDRLEVGMTVYYVQSGALAAAVKEIRAEMAALSHANQNIDALTMNKIETNSDTPATADVATGMTNAAYLTLNLSTTANVALNAGA